MQKKEYSSNSILKIDFVILAYNEEKVILEKILNSLECLKRIKGAQLWLVSDGSTDKTNEIATSLIDYANFHFVPLKRSGKSQSINRVIPLLNGDVVVFSDANVEFTESTIPNLLKPFSNNDVGCTCGKVVYRNPNNVLSGDGESFYWKYENEIKKLESIIGYVAGATGAFGGNIEKALLFSSGFAKNPQVELLFENIANREFLFDFKFVPRNPQEAKDIIKIIQTFRFFAAPEIPTTGKGRYFVPPSEFDIEFMVGSKINPNLPPPLPLQR